MDIISCIFIVLILAFILFGFIKGFLRSLLYYARGILSFFIALIFCQPLANLFQSLSFVQQGKITIQEWLYNQNTLFRQTFYPEEREKVLDALKSLSIPDFFASFLADKITPSIPSGGIELGVTVADALMMTLLTIFSFIILIIAVRILLMILRRFTKMLLNRLPTIKIIDRIFGLLLGAFIGIVVVDFICILFTGIMSVPFFDNFSMILNEQMALNQEQEFRISKFFYENNLLLKLFAFFF